MRPHRLRVTAFGAFGGTVEVCFDDLASAGLFLLHGETGAGKTTLLDAIGFALYGRVPGERGKARRLRSDHAAEGTSTEVQLEATLGGRRMRITRRPEQQRPKRRGGGTTTEQAKVVLEEHDGTSWRAVSTRAGEADEEIRTLVGMSAEQFYQVVLLPQGMFAQFLHAAADKRAELLEKLFGTDRFGKVEAWLAERRRTTTRAVDAAEQDVRALAAVIAQVAGPDPADPGDPDGSDPAAFDPGDLGGSDPAALDPGDLGGSDPAALDPGDRESVGQASGGRASGGRDTGRRVPGGWDPSVLPGSAWAPQLAAVAAATAEDARARVRTLSTELDHALARQRDAESLAGRQRRRAAALHARDDLTAAAPSIGAQREELAAAARAAEAAGALDENERASGVLVRARAEQQRAAAEAGSRAGADPRATAAELRAAGQEHVARLGRLDALRPLQKQAAEETEYAAAARMEAGLLAGQLAEAEAILAAGQQQRPLLAAERDQSRQASQLLPDRAAAADACRRAAADAAALVTARVDARRQEDAYFAARLETSALRDEASRLREARIDGMRAELAAALVDGTPCPVCGSLDHPELCELRGERVTREQEEAADARAAEAADRAEEAGAKLAAADIQVTGLTARLADGGFSVPADLATLEAEAARLAVRAEELAAELTQLTAQAARLRDLQAELEGMDTSIAATGRLLTELTAQRDEALRQAEAADERAEGHRRSLLTQLDGLPDLDSATRAAGAAAEALLTAADAADAVARAEQAAADARERALKAAVAAGFADLDAVRAAQRPADWRTAAERDIRSHEASVRATDELLADPELDVPLDPPADLDGTGAAVQAAQLAHDEALAAHDRAQHRADQLADLAPRLTAQLSALQPLAEKAAEARQLADLAAGQGANTLRMTLSSFVLAARLEEVAAAASQRLLAMTSGRYRLVHTDARRGTVRSGLGLLACDAWTGVDRDTSTLSGGETFLASLALALGLADVVTAEAGGTRIEALFVDEGFGSLDEETLEEVMTVLDGLREGGRMVGIVSHVAELKQRIPAQIRVHKGHAGSHLSLSAPSNN